MSLVKCWECGKEVSSTSKKCTYCGAAKKKSKWRWLLYAFVIWVILDVGLTFFMKLNYRSTIDSSDAVDVVAVEKAKAWEYLTSNDAMTDKPTTFATIFANEKLNFSSPYKGLNEARLVIRKGADGAQDVMFFIDKGQISCGSINCYVSARFDDEIISFKYGKSADSDPKMIFIEGSDKFIKKLKTTKLLRLEVSFYQQGTKVLTFNTVDFKWD